MKRVVAIVTGCAFAGMVAGAAWPPPPILKSQLDEPAWVLPGQGRVERFSQEAFEAARQIRWAGDAASGGSERDSGWALAGILDTPTPVALVVPAAGPAQQVVVGATLPDGSRLAAINEDSITTDSEGCMLTFQLHRAEPVAASGNCPPTSSGTAPRNP